jgi:hypothetical protein
MRARPVLAVSTALALLGGAVAGPVMAAVDTSADAPAAGSASSSLTLLDVAVGGQVLSVLQLALRSDTASGTPTTSFVVTPLTHGGVPYGRQSVGSRSTVLPAVESARHAPAALSAVAAARSPQIDVRSDGGASSASLASLGSLSVLGLPLAADGAATISSVVDAAGSSGSKTLTVDRLALPSLADLLAALGLDVAGLPTASLTNLVDGLDLGSTSIQQARTALEAVQAQVQSQVDAAEGLVAETGDAVQAAEQQVAETQAALAAATGTLNDATRALSGTAAGLRTRSLTGRSTVGGLLDGSLDEVIEVVTAPLPSPSPLPLVQDVVDQVEETTDPVLDAVTSPLQPVVDPVVETVEQVLPLPPITLTPDLQPLVDAHDAAKAAYDQALAAVAAAEAALDTAGGLLADAVAGLQALLAPYRTQVDTLVAAVMDVLDTTPLVSLDRLEVTTRSAVTTAAAGGQTAEIVGGEIEGLRVLGTDVLVEALGSSELEILDLTGTVQSTVNAAVAGLTGTLSEVLSAVPGLPALRVPAPTIDLLTRATVTDVVDGYGVAGSALRALTVTWPALTIPAAAALPGAAALPAVSGQLPALPIGALRSQAVTAAGDVLSQPLTLSLATFEDRARFRPALRSGQPGTTAPGTGTPGTGTPGTGTPGTGTPGTGELAAPGTDSSGGGSQAGSTADPRPLPAALSQQLPRTGAGSATSVLALLLVAAALALHRRYGTA